MTSYLRSSGHVFGILATAQLKPLHVGHLLVAFAVDLVVCPESPARVAESLGDSVATEAAVDKKLKRLPGA